MTENVYDNRWARWQDWCNEHSVECLNPSAPEVANFLTLPSIQHNMSANTVRGHRCAISTSIRQMRGGGGEEGRVRFKQHTTVDVRGLSLREARQPSGTPKWDPFVVFDALRRLPFYPCRSNLLL